MATASQASTAVRGAPGPEPDLAEVVVQLQDKLIRLTQMDRDELTARALILFEIARKAEQEGYSLAIVNDDDQVLNRVVGVAQELASG